MPYPHVASVSSSRIAVGLIVGSRATRWWSLHGRCVERGQYGVAEAQGAAVRSMDNGTRRISWTALR